MLPEQFNDRFDGDTYSSDEPVRVWLVEEYGPDNEFYVSESLWRRVRLIASAYDLHLLPLLDGSTDPVFLNAKQCETLVDESTFIGSVVDDDLVQTLADRLRGMAIRARGASKNALGVEFP